MFTASAVSGVLLHEPVLVLAGHRGARVRGAEAGRARAWAGLWAACGAVAGVGAVLALRERAWVMAIPAVPAAMLFMAAAIGREKTPLAELSASLAFALTAAPVCAAAGMPIEHTIFAVTAFGANGVLSTLGVRAVVKAARRAVEPAGAVRARRAAVAAAVVCGGLVVAAVFDGFLRLLPALAFVPGSLGAVALALRPPRPQQLRTTGWLLAAGSGVTAVMVLAGLHG